MKRYVKNLINWFTDYFVQFEWKEIVGFVIALMLGCAWFMAYLKVSDTTPATPDDYKPLKNQAKAVAQNPKLLREIDCDINIESGIITVKFENDECKVFAKYDKNFALLSTSEKDKSEFWICVVGCAFLTATFLAII